MDDANPKKVANKTVETPVLDYMTQQYRLFPIIAQAYACHFTAIEMHRMFNENQAKMAQGDFSYLADLHASSSGLKSLTTTMGVAGIEECRRACGGHGYSLFSGIGLFYQDQLPKATVSCYYYRTRTGERGSDISQFSLVGRGQLHFDTANDSLPPKDLPLCSSWQSI